MVDAVGVDALRRHEVRRAARGLAVDHAAGGRQAEVRQLDVPAGGEHQVLRLDVAVDQVVALGEGQRQGGVAHGGDGFAPTHRPGLLQPLLEGAARHQLHRVEVELAFVADVVDLDQVGVAEAAGGDRLAPEGGDLVGVLRGLGVQDLERHLAVEAGLQRPVDDADGAAAEPAEQLVAGDLLADERVGCRLAAAQAQAAGLLADLEVDAAAGGEQHLAAALAVDHEGQAAGGAELDLAAFSGGGEAVLLGARGPAQAVEQAVGVEDPGPPAAQRQHTFLILDLPVDLQNKSARQRGRSGSRSATGGKIARPTRTRVAPSSTAIS